MGAIAAALVGAVLLAIPGSPIYRAPVKGLDLQGGLEVILRATPEKGQSLSQAGMQTAQSIMESRVNKIGVASPNVAIQGGNEIVIQLAGVHDPAKAAKIVGTTGQLQMFDFEPNLMPPTVNGGQPAPLPSLYGLLTAVKKEAGKGSPEAYYLFKTVTKKIPAKGKGKTATKAKTKTFHSVVQGPTKNLKQLLLPYKNGQPPDTQVLKVPANREPVWCAGVGNCPGAGSNGTSSSNKYWYLFRSYSDRKAHPNGPPELTGNDLV